MRLQYYSSHLQPGRLLNAIVAKRRRTTNNSHKGTSRFPCLRHVALICVYYLPSTHLNGSKNRSHVFPQNITLLRVKTKLHTVFCRNKRPGRLILRSNKQTSPSNPSKAIKSPLISCTPPFEKSPIKSHRFRALPPLKNHSSKAIGFMYSPLWKIIHQKPLVLCTPPFEKWLYLVGAYFGVGVYFGKYGTRRIMPFSTEYIFFRAAF